MTDEADSAGAPRAQAMAVSSTTRRGAATRKASTAGRAAPKKAAAKKAPAKKAAAKKAAAKKTVAKKTAAKKGSRDGRIATSSTTGRAASRDAIGSNPSRRYGSGGSRSLAT